MAKPEGTEPIFEGAAKGKRASQIVVVSITVITVVIAGLSPALLSVWGNSPVPRNTITGLGALALVEASLVKTTSESWTLISDVGVASHDSYTPWVIGGIDGSLINASISSLATLWACGSLPLTTVWNTSGLPVRGGNLTDGFAPFWEFLFANASGSSQFVFAIGTYVSGSVKVLGPLNQANPCIRALGLGPGFVPPIASLPSLETDIGGELAYRALTSLDAHFGPYAVVWTNGWPIIANSGWDSTIYTFGAGWIVTFYECGLVGVSPASSTITSWHVVVWLQNGIPTSGGASSTRFGCTLPSYNVTITEQASSRQGTGFAASFSLADNGFSAGSYVADEQGLAAWMVLPKLQRSLGGAPELAPDLCPHWLNGIASCDVPAAGWYAVLLSPGGQWLDSYGVINGSPAWADPGVPVISTETVDILSAFSLSSSGITFQLSSNVTSPVIASNIVTP
jgi:hypothetical protein